MKWRNQLLALFCLLVFFGFGVFYFQYWVVQKPFGIILFIAEGLDAETLTAARLRAGGPGHPLALDSFPYIALLKNQSADSPIPDPAAAATAIATGVRVRNGAVAVEGDGQPLASLLDLARESGRVTGLISDGKITEPIAASFYGHGISGEEGVDFAHQLSETAEIDLVLGQGAADFLPPKQGGHRTDERDLVSAMRGANYKIVQSLAQLEEIPRWREAKVFGLFDQNELPSALEPKSSDGRPATLTDLVRRGIELLQYHRNGYLLVVDATQMRKARHEGNREKRLKAALELDRAISVALEYAGKKSAIFVSGDIVDRRASADAVTMEKAPAPSSRGNFPVIFENTVDGLALEMTNKPGKPPFGFPEVKDSTGESFPSPVIFPAEPLPTPKPLSPAGIPENVLAFGTGLGSDDLRGTQDSTELFEIIRNNL